MAQLSVVQYCGPHEGGSCGYCKSTARAKAKRKEETEKEDDDEEGDSCSFDVKRAKHEQGQEEGSSRKVSFGALFVFLGKQFKVWRFDGGEDSNFAGLWAHKLSSAAYSALLDRGWRRSGCYLYKPTMDRTCCPQYTIRLDVNKFVLSRTQKRALHDMAKFLRGNAGPKKVEPMLHGSTAASTPPRSTTGSSIPDITVDAQPTATNPRRPPGGKKKAARREQAIARWKAKGIDVETKQKERREKEAARKRSLEDRIADGEGGEHQLTVRLVRASPPSKEYQESKDIEFALYEKYQERVHDDKRASFSGFENFLVNTPMAKIREATDGILPALGSYHQQYWMDEKLVAVGVIDILPRCMSSKYMFYDPDLPNLNLGTYTALREIAFTRKLAKDRPELHFYYMGFYIESCPKMRYKGAFRPSELLCDRTFQWVPLEECRKMLASNGGKFTVFKPDSDPPPRPSRDEITVIYKGQCLPYGLIKVVHPESLQVIEELDQYAQLVGEANKLMALYLPKLTENDEDSD